MVSSDVHGVYQVQSTTVAVRVYQLLYVLLYDLHPTCLGESGKTNVLSRQSSFFNCQSRLVLVHWQHMENNL